MATYCRDHWQPDDSRKDCAKCRSPFTFTNRRHHCRNCGGLFCKNCSSKTSTVPRRQISTPVRVCDACHKSLMTNQASDQPRTGLASTTGQNNGGNAAASPARAEPVLQQPVVFQPVVEVVQEVPLTNVYGVIKEEAGKAYLDVAVAAVREVVYDESQCSEQPYEFDAAGGIVLALPVATAKSSMDVMSILLGDSGKKASISDKEVEVFAEGLRRTFEPQFPNLVMPFGAIQGL